MLQAVNTTTTTQRNNSHAANHNTPTDTKSNYQRHGWMRTNVRVGHPVLTIDETAVVSSRYAAGRRALLFAGAVELRPEVNGLILAQMHFVTRANQVALVHQAETHRVLEASRDFQDLWKELPQLG